MFDSIAPRYDLLNSLLSVRLHHGWRRHAARLAKLQPGDAALDVCTGTGDFAFELVRYVGKDGAVTATDFSEPMLAYGERKRRERELSNVRLVVADTQALPFAENTFHAVTVGFGIRNVADRAKGLAEMVRVVRPGGRVIILEFNQPTHPLFAGFYRWYSFQILPWFGGLISGKRSAYEYLPSSVEAFPSRDALAEELRQAGLTDIQVIDLTFGTVAIHVGTKKS
jgi:demethylmenaquinone methyltransferase/2-methoxy-6-polyprenyl-1,4-benzoquinol methylase